MGKTRAIHLPLTKKKKKVSKEIKCFIEPIIHI
jgi:hypothetical protein